MARAHRHGGGQKSAFSRRYRGAPGATPRTASIMAYADRQLAQTGLLPSVEQVASAFAMSPDKVEAHFRILGLVR